MEEEFPPASAGVEEKKQPQSPQYSSSPLRAAPQTAQTCGAAGAAGAGASGSGGGAGGGATATASADLPLSAGSGFSAGVVVLSRANMACRLGGADGFGSDAMTACYLRKEWSHRSL